MNIFFPEFVYSYIWEKDQFMAIIKNFHFDSLNIFFFA